MPQATCHHCQDQNANNGLNTRAKLQLHLAVPRGRRGLGPQKPAIPGRPSIVSCRRCSLQVGRCGQLSVFEHPRYPQARPRSLESPWAVIFPLIGGVGSCQTLFQSQTRFCLPTGSPSTSHWPQESGQLSNCTPVGIRLGRFLWLWEPTLDLCCGWLCLSVP